MITLHAIDMTNQDEQVSGDAEMIRDWLRGLIKAAGSTPTAVARQAGVGQSTLARFLGGETKSLSKLTIGALVRTFHDAAPEELRLMVSGEPGSQLAPVMFGLDRSTDNRVPVWAAIAHLGSAEFELKPAPIGWLAAPSAAARFAKLVAFYAPDETMAPRWHTGEPVIVDLARPAAPGDPCLARLLPEDDATKPETFLFRVLGQRGDGAVRFTTLADPADEVRIAIRRILEIRRVLSWADLVG